MAESEIEQDAVLAALDRLTSWSEMARSPQLTRFLDYIVRRRLAGDSQSIKAYSIAVDVFGRAPDFDPQADPIVRVQARRLRALLDQYYRGPGAEEVTRIELPIGRYVPDFVTVDPANTLPRALAFSDQDQGLAPVSPAPATVPKGHFTVSWFVLLVIAIAAGALAYSLSTWGPRQGSIGAAQGGLQQPNLRVMEFQNLTGDTAITASVSGLSVELINRLQPLNFIHVDYGGRGDIQADDGPDDGYVLTGIVRRDPALPTDLQYNISLSDRSNNGVIWNRTLRLPEAQLSSPGRIDRLSIDLMGVLGNPRGPLHTKARRAIDQGLAPGQENLYTCRLLFTMYRETLSSGAAQRANSCYAALPAADQQTGIALAAVASLTAEMTGATPGSNTARLERLGRAVALVTEALRIAPTNSFVWEQRARLYEGVGEHELAEEAYGTALQINPANMDAVAAHARHLALIGAINEAIPLAQRALDVYTIIPNWYFGVPALAALRDGDYARAARYAESYSRADTELGPIFSLMVANASGDAESVGRLLPTVLSVPSFRTGGIMTALRRRITDTELLGRIRQALVDAGVPPLSLVTSF
jgi:tetratricopeptide (TPR) repeat protein